MVGRVMANLVTFLNPSVLVVDGTLGPAARFVAEGLRDSVNGLIYSGRSPSPVITRSPTRPHGLLLAPEQFALSR